MIYPNEKHFMSRQNTSRTAWNRWLQGHWLVNYIPYLLFLGVLAVIYIGNGHFADNTIRNTGRAIKNLRKLQYEHKAIQAEVVYRSRAGELARVVEPLGLSIHADPPVALTPDTLHGQ